MEKASTLKQNSNNQCRPGLKGMEESMENILREEYKNGWLPWKILSSKRDSEEKVKEICLEYVSGTSRDEGTQTYVARSEKEKDLTYVKPWFWRQLFKEKTIALPVYDAATALCCGIYNHGHPIVPATLFDNGTKLLVTQELACVSNLTPGDMLSLKKASTFVEKVKQMVGEHGNFSVKYSPYSFRYAHPYHAVDIGEVWKFWAYIYPDLAGTEIYIDHDSCLTQHVVIHYCDEVYRGHTNEKDVREAIRLNPHGVYESVNWCPDVGAPVEFRIRGCNDLQWTTMKARILSK
jgi:hypothetical protein